MSMSRTAKRLAERKEKLHTAFTTLKSMSKQIYYDEINRIKTLLIGYSEYYQEKYPNITEEGSFNENLKIKNLIKDLIIKTKEDIFITENDKYLIKNEALKLLAENTGCVEDCKISEIILEELKNKQIIDKNYIDYYYSHENTGRWK